MHSDRKRSSEDKCHLRKYGAQGVAWNAMSRYVALNSATDRFTFPAVLKLQDAALQAAILLTSSADQARI